MAADSQGFQENEHAAPPAEQRSGTERRMSAGRRRGESVGGMQDTPAASPVKEPKSVRKYHFRSFEARRSGADRRAHPCDQEDESCRSLPDADDERG
jgi:hypothetical protein